MVGARAADAEALDAARLQERPQQARAPLLAGLAAAGHRQARCAAVRRRQIPAAGRVADGPQRVDAALRHPRDSGRVRLPHHESCARGEIPAAGRA